MAEYRLEAETRTEFGKGSARRTRRAGRVPGVLYGHGQDVVHLSLPAREFAAALRNGGVNALVTVVVEGKDQLALPRAVQRDPLTRVHQHVDLLIVRKGEKVIVDVPVYVVGQPAPDTIVNLELQSISVEADATMLPNILEVDVTGRRVGQNFTAADIKLPAGTTMMTDADEVVVGFLGAPTAADLEAELSEAEADAGIEKDETDEEAAESEAAESTEDKAASDESPAADA